MQMVSSSSVTIEPFDYKRLSEVCFICQPTVFLRAEVIRTVGPLDVTLDYCMDMSIGCVSPSNFESGTSKNFSPIPPASRYQNTPNGEVHQETLQWSSDTMDKYRCVGSTPMRMCTEREIVGKMQGLYADGWASRV